MLPMLCEDVIMVENHSKNTRWLLAYGGHREIGFLEPLCICAESPFHPRNQVFGLTKVRNGSTRGRTDV